MTKISDQAALTGAGVDRAVDLFPIVDMSAAGAARNKKITIAEAKLGLDLGTAADLDIDIDDALAADSDSLIPTQQAVKAYVDANVGGANDLDDLSDVDLTGLADGDTLVYDLASGDFVPIPLPGGGLGGTVPDGGSDGQVLTKQSGTDQDIDWETPTAPGLVLIEEYTGDGTTGTKTFSSIPGTYRALRLEWVGRSSDGAATVNMAVQFNGDASAIYDRQQITASAATVSGAEGFAATSAVIGTLPAAGATANYPGTGLLTIPEYAGTTFHKQGMTDHAFQSATSTASFSRRLSSIGWRSTAAITSLTAALTAGNYVTGSKLRLYGAN